MEGFYPTSAPSPPLHGAGEGVPARSSSSRMRSCTSLWVSGLGVEATSRNLPSKAWNFLTSMAGGFFASARCTSAKAAARRVRSSGVTSGPRRLVRSCSMVSNAHCRTFGPLRSSRRNPIPSRATSPPQPISNGLLQPDAPGGRTGTLAGWKGLGVSSEDGCWGGSTIGFSNRPECSSILSEERPPREPSGSPYNEGVRYDPLPSSPPPARSPRPARPPGRRLMRWALPVVVALFLGALTGVTVAAAIHVPRVESLVGYTPSLVTQLYAADGSVFATFARERRVMLKESEIPKIVQQAVLASEDANFFQHGGVDAVGILRAAWTDLRAGKVVEGASTITMQLARSLYLTRARTWSRKIEEAFVAVELEKNLSKPQILALYLNLVNLGHGNYGFEAASRYYFGKPAAKLSLTEAATLAGIIPAPSRYSPYRNPEQVTRQRDRVLRRMLDERYITRRQYEQAVEQPLLVTSQQPEQAVAPYFAEDIRKYLETKYGATALYEGGLQVRTTLDPRIQQAT
ncbi:MAG TPA: hypothetical protein DD490_28790, partial [Acidobacteria bacterium]|nr:hypothetical protein [Acidobacteriota bacterium]